MASGQDEFTTTIGPDAVFKGELSFDKAMKLLGRVEGEIKSKGTLYIGEGASLSGDAKAETVRLDGEVKGNITASAKVQLSASARLEGDLQTARLEVAEGAILVGKCTIGVSGNGQSQAGPVKTAPAAANIPAANKTVAQKR